MSGFSLKRALSDAVSFVPQAWMACWLSLLLLLGLGFIAIKVEFTDYGMTMWGLAFITVVLMVLGGLYRAAIFGKNANKSGLGFGGVQLGSAEIRLITGGFYSASFLCFVGVFAAMIVILVASNTELSTHYNNSFKTILAAFFEPFTTEKIVIIAFTAFFGVMLLSLVVGLLPYQVASIAQNRTISINALRFSQGKFVKMLLGLGMIVCPLLGLAFIFISSRINLDQNMRATLIYLGVGLFVSAVLPLLIGFLASIYKQSPPSGMT